MKNSDVDNDLVTRTLLLGVMSGMRSVAGLAAISSRAAAHSGNFKNTPFSLLASKEAERLVSVAALGEIIADKVPFLPSRIAPLPLLGRTALGGVAGAAAYAEAKESALTGAVLGGGGALVSSFLGYFLRRGLGKLLHLPDLPVALMEDAVVFRLRKAVLDSY